MNPKPLSLTSRLIVPFIGAAIAVSQRKRVDTRSRWEGKTFLEAPRLPEDRSAQGIARLAQIAREHRAYARSPGIANPVVVYFSRDCQLRTALISPASRGASSASRNFCPSRVTS